MRDSPQVKPIRYLKANAAEVLKQIAEQRVPMVITQHGEAKAVLQDVASFEETQEALALLKNLCAGQSGGGGRQAQASGRRRGSPLRQASLRLMAGKPAKFEILLTEGAEQDLVAIIYDYICESDCATSANRVLDALMAVVANLSKFPERGSYPRELVGLGIKEYRQTLFKPYGVNCRVTGRQVIIYLILDGRRDMQSVLARCLLGA